MVQSFTNRTVDVYSYDTTVAPTCNVPIVTGVTAWDCPSNGATYILVFHESLFYGDKLDHTLINPNQIRHNGIDYWDNPYDQRHGLCIEVDGGPTIDLAMDGTKVTFKSRAPSQHELNTCDHIDMTSSFRWEPHDVKLGETRVNVDKAIDDFIGESDRLLQSIDPSLIMLKEMSTRHIQANSYIDVTAVESSTFTSEFIALKTCMESIVALRYKLRMFGIQFEGPTKVLCDNKSVVDNSSKIESKLNKKHNAIAYHAVRWAVAAATILVGWIDGEWNLSDAMTKRLTAQRREFLFGCWTY